MKRFPEVRFVTAKEVLAYYPETAGAFNASQIEAALVAMGSDPTWVRVPEGV